jgi:hypothetical protein
MPGLDDTRAKDPADWTIEELAALREDFLKNLSPQDRARPEFWPVGDPKGPKAVRLHHRMAIGAAALQDDSNPTLVAFGILAGGNPPTSAGKIYNWGQLAHTNVGVYTLVLGEGGVDASQMIVTTWAITFAAGLPFISLASTNATTKVFSVKDNNVLVDTATFGFAIYRMPPTA